jgi:hypothetical protein
MPTKNKPRSQEVVPPVVKTCKLIPIQYKIYITDMLIPR